MSASRGDQRAGRAREAVEAGRAYLADPAATRRAEVEQLVRELEAR